MKSVILMGSPNKKGHTMEIINELENELGGTFKMYNPYRMEFKPCNDCEYCHKNRGCCIEDDAQEMYRDLEGAELVIVASPMYFGMISGPLLSLLSRLQFCFANEVILKTGRPFRRKYGIFVMTAAQSWFNMFSPCLDTAKFIFDHMNADHVANILIDNTDTIAAKDQPELFSSIKRTVKYLEAAMAAE